jgi:hypothetical protein
MTTEHWKSDDWQGRAKVLGGMPTSCYFVHHKFHMDCYGIEPGPPRCETGYQLLELLTITITVIMIAVESN